MSDPAKQLQTYLVGGAVRDRLLGWPVSERDWVVVGASPEEMARLGFKPVGKDFPVFLHPHTHEQYALARTERKVARGYHGFQFNSSRTVTLEQDLARRDLTINAIAQDHAGNLIDPYNGQRDLAAKCLRHVSAAFREDPVRILRIAKFAARYHAEDFHIAKSTRTLLRAMVANGEAAALVAERVWQEMFAALQRPHCHRFIRELRDCDALAVVLPEVDALFGVPQVAHYHPEIDTGVHTLMALAAADTISDEPLVRFAVLTHDLGKARTPAAMWPSHRGHEKAGLQPIDSLCTRLAVPRIYREFARRVCELHLHCHRIAELRPATVLMVLEKLDGFRQPHRVQQFADCCLADRRGRSGHANASTEQVNLLLAMHAAAQQICGRTIAEQCTTIDPVTNSATNPTTNPKAPGTAIKTALRNARIAAIRRVKDGK